MSANTFLPPSPVAPMSLVIASISNAYHALVTVTTANNYLPNQLVYFSVPPDYGMTQINALTGQILSVDNTNLIFTMNIDTTYFDVLVLPSGNKEKPASLAPSGSRN